MKHPGRNPLSTLPTSWQTSLSQKPLSSCSTAKHTDLASQGAAQVLHTWVVSHVSDQLVRNEQQSVKRSPPTAHTQQLR